MDILGVQVLAERGGAHHVEKQDRDLLELLRGLGRPGQGRQPGAQSTQQRALGFQSSDGSLNLLQLGRHGYKNSNATRTGKATALQNGSLTASLPDSWSQSP